MKTPSLILKCLLLWCLAAALSSCGHALKDLPILPIPKTVEVAPKVTAIRPALDAANDSTVALKAANASLGRQVQTAKQQADDLKQETARLAQAGVASAAELVKVATSNAALAAKVGELQAEVDSQSKLLDEQSRALTEARAAQADAQAAAAAGDMAQWNLVEQVKSLDKQVIDAKKEARDEHDKVVALQTKLTAEEEKSRKWFWIAMGAFGLIGIYILLRVLVFFGKLRIPL